MKRLCIVIALLAFVTGCDKRSGPVPVEIAGSGAGALPGEVVVGPQDTLYSIAKSYGVTIRDLIEENHLSPPYTFTGPQKLRIALPRTYTAQQGDTVNGIARRFGVDIYQLVQLNNMKSSYLLTPGQQVKLPSVHSARPVAPAKFTWPQKDEKANPAMPLQPVEQAALNPPSAPIQKPAPTLQEQRAATISSSLPKTPALSGQKFFRPVQGRLIQTFGPKADGLQNDGINIAAPLGAAVKAAENGVIVYSGNDLQGFGNLLLIRHDGGWVTGYAHLDNVLVKRGDVVTRGEAIGTVGKTGTVNQPQLHFEIRKDSVPIDPETQL
jgi:murein DD-endopeptidase MepM/ murein hydrolase activator NlpD